MPLRDHFRPPVWNQASWEGFHGGWPMMMVLNLAPQLPKGFAAEPRVHLGTYFEIDVCTFEKDGERDWHSDQDPATDGGVATATSIEFSVVSGGLACIAGAVLIGLLMPHFRHHHSGEIDEVPV